MDECETVNKPRVLCVAGGAGHLWPHFTAAVAVTAEVPR